MNLKKYATVLILSSLISAIEADSLPIRRNQVAIDFELFGDKTTEGGRSVLNTKYVDNKTGMELSRCYAKFLPSFFKKITSFSNACSAILTAAEVKTTNINMSNADWSKYSCARTSDYAGACWVRSLGLKENSYMIEACFQNAIGEPQCVELKNGESKGFWRTEVRDLGVLDTGYQGGYSGDTSDCPDTTTNINALGYAFIYEATQKNDDGAGLKYKNKDDFYNNYCKPLAEKYKSSTCSSPVNCPCDDDCKKNNFLPPKDSYTWKTAKQKTKECYMCWQNYRGISFYCPKVYKCLMEVEDKSEVYDLAMDREKRKYLSQIYGRGNYTCAYYRGNLCGCAKTKLSGGPRHFLRIARQDNVADKEANASKLAEFPQHNLFSTSVYVRQFYNKADNDTQSRCPYPHRAEFGYEKRGTFFFPKLTIVAGKNERRIGYKYDYIKADPDFYYNKPIGIREEYKDNVSKYNFPTARRIIFSYFYPVVFTIGSTYLMVDEEKGGCVEKPSQDIAYVMLRLEYNLSTNSTALVAYRVSPIKTLPASMNSSDPKMLFSDGSIAKFVATDQEFINQVKNVFTYDYDPSQHFVNEKKKMDIKSNYKLLFENIGKVERPPLKYTYQSNDSQFIVSPIVLEQDMTANDNDDKFATKLKISVIPYNLKAVSENEFENDLKLPAITSRLSVSSLSEDAYTLSGNLLDSGDVSESASTILYMKKFSVGYPNSCVTLKGISGSPGTDLLLDPPDDYSKCSQYTNAKDRLHCLSAYLLVEDCNAYVSCLPNSPSIEACKRENRGPKIKITGTNYQLDSYKINTDFRQYTQVCVIEGFDFADRLSDLSNTKLFGKFGNPVYDYTIRYNREYGSAFTSPTRPLGLKGKEEKPNSSNDYQDDPRYMATMDINYFSSSKEDRFENMMSRLKGMFIIDGDNLPTEQSLLQHYANDCLYNKDICKKRFSVEHRLISETQGSLCIEATALNGGTWDLKERELPYDVYIPYRCQYVYFHGKGAGGAGFTSESHTACISQFHVTLLSWQLGTYGILFPIPMPTFTSLAYRRLPKYDATGSEGGDVNVVIDIGKIKIFDGYFQVSIGARTKKVRAEIPTHDSPHDCFVGTGENGGVVESASINSSWIAIGGSHRFWYKNGKEFIGKRGGYLFWDKDSRKFIWKTDDRIYADNKKGSTYIAFDTHGISAVKGTARKEAKEKRLETTKNEFNELNNNALPSAMKYYYYYTTLKRYFASLMRRANELYYTQLILHKAIEICIDKVKATYSTAYTNATTEYNNAKKAYDDCKKTNCSDLTDKEAKMNDKKKVYDDYKAMFDDEKFPYNSVLGCDFSKDNTDYGSFIQTHLAKMNNERNLEEADLNSTDSHFSKDTLTNAVGSSGFEADLEDLNNKIAEEPTNILRNEYLQRVYELINSYIPYLRCLLRDTKSALSKSVENDSCNLVDRGIKIKNGLKKSNITLSSNTPNSVKQILNNIETIYEEVQTDVKTFTTSVLAEINQNNITEQYNQAKTEYDTAKTDYENCANNTECTDLNEKSKNKDEKEISFQTSKMIYDFITYNKEIDHIIALYNDSVEHGKEISQTTNDYKTTTTISKIETKTITETKNNNPEVPEIYRQVEYIESSGTQYIDTGLSLNNYDDKGKSIIITQTVQYSTISGDYQLDGAYDDDGTLQFGVYNGKWSYNVRGTGLKDGTTATTNKVSIIIDTGSMKYTVNGTENSLGNSVNDKYPSKTLFLFAKNDVSSYQDGISFKAKKKLYSYSISVGGTLLRNFVPVYRVSDNVIGLYDTIGKTFYTNKGTGNFTKGKDDVTTTTRTEEELKTETVDVFDGKTYKKEHLANFYPLSKALSSVFDKTPSCSCSEGTSNCNCEMSAGTTNQLYENEHKNCTYLTNANSISQDLLKLCGENNITKDSNNNITSSKTSPITDMVVYLGDYINTSIQKMKRLSTSISDLQTQIDAINNKNTGEGTALSYYQVVAEAMPGISPIDCRITNDGILKSECPYIDNNKVRSGIFVTARNKDAFPLFGEGPRSRCGRDCSRTGLYCIASNIPTLSCLGLRHIKDALSTNNGGEFEYVKDYLYEGEISKELLPNAKYGTGSETSTDTDNTMDVTHDYDWDEVGFRNKAPSDKQNSNADYVNGKIHLKNDQVGAGGAFIHRKGTGAGGPGDVELSVGKVPIYQYDGNFGKYPKMNNDGKKIIFSSKNKNANEIAMAKRDAMCAIRCPPIYVLKKNFGIFFPTINRKEDVDMICEYIGTPESDMEAIINKKHGPYKCYIVSDKSIDGVGNLKGKIFVRDGYCPIANCVNGIWGFTTNTTGGTVEQIQFDRKAMMCKPMSIYNGISKSSFYYSMMFDKNTYTAMSFKNSSVLSILLDTGKSHVIAECAQRGSSDYIIDKYNQLSGNNLALECSNGFWQDPSLVDTKTVELYELKHKFNARVFPDDGQDSETKQITDEDDKARDNAYNVANTHMYDTEYLIKNYSYQIGDANGEEYKTTGIAKLKETGRQVFSVYCPPIIEGYNFDTDYSGNAIWEEAKEYQEVSAKGCRANRFVNNTLPTRTCMRNGMWGPVFNPCLKGCDDEEYDGIKWTLSSLGENWSPTPGQQSVKVTGACAGKYLNSMNFLENSSGNSATRTCNLLLGTWNYDVQKTGCNDGLVCTSDNLNGKTNIYTPFIRVAVLDEDGGFAKLKENIENGVVKMSDYTKYDESLYLVFNGEKKHSNTFNIDYYATNNSYVSVNIIQDGSIDLKSSSESKYITDEEGHRIIPYTSSEGYLIIQVKNAVSPSAFSYMLAQGDNTRNEFLNVANWINFLNEDNQNFTGQWAWKGNLSQPFYKGILANTQSETKQRYKNAELLVIIKKTGNTEKDARHLALFSPYFAKTIYNKSFDDTNIKFRVPSRIPVGEEDNNVDPYPMIVYGGLHSSSRVYRFEWQKNGDPDWMNTVYKDEHTIGEHDCNGKYFGYIRHNTMKHVMFTETPLDEDIYFASLFCYDGRIFGYHVIKVNFPQNQLLNDVYTSDKFLAQTVNGDDFSSKIYHFMIDYLNEINATRVINANSSYSIEKNSYIAGMMMKYWQANIIPPEYTIELFRKNYNPSTDTSADTAENTNVKNVLQNYKNGANGYYYRVVPRRSEWITGTVSNVIKNLHQITELDDKDPYCQQAACQNKKTLSDELNNLVNGVSTNGKKVNGVPVPNWQMCEV